MLDTFKIEFKCSSDILIEGLTKSIFEVRKPGALHNRKNWPTTKEIGEWNITDNNKLAYSTRDPKKPSHSDLTGRAVAKEFGNKTILTIKLKPNYLIQTFALLTIWCFIYTIIICISESPISAFLPFFIVLFSTILYVYLYRREGNKIVKDSLENVNDLMAESNQ